MSDYVNNDGYELGWDAEIEKEGTPFVVAEPGDYNFTVINFERGRFEGSTKMPPCNQAKLTLRLEMPNGSTCDIKHNLFLHSKSEWRLCEFFTAIGQRQHGQRIAMNWNAVLGAHGRCKISKRSFKSKDGKDMWTNDVDKFYDPDGSIPFQTSNPPQQNQVPQSQPAYQAPAQQNYQQQGFGGYTPGKF